MNQNMTLAKLADEIGNADDWIVVTGLEKNVEYLLVLFFWFWCRDKGDIELCCKICGGGDLGEVVTAGWERGEEKESGGMVGGGPFLFYIPSALSLPSDNPTSLPQSLALVFGFSLPPRRPLASSANRHQASR